jgi:hypothetical protein
LKEVLIQVLEAKKRWKYYTTRIRLISITPSRSSSLQGIGSISLDLGKYLYDPKSGIQCKSFQLAQWTECWEAVAKMEGLEEVRVRFRTLVEGWMGSSEREVLQQLWKVRREMKVFEVEASTDVMKAFMTRRMGLMHRSLWLGMCNFQGDSPRPQF